MPRSVRRDFNALPPRARKAILEILEGEEVKDIDCLVIAGIQQPRCGSETNGLEPEGDELHRRHGFGD
jgi:hypothetical protein